MKVIKTRANRYHTNRDCTALDKASRNTKEIDLETAKAWDLEKCERCSGNGGPKGEYKWWHINKSLRES